jgi:hypothetical protein
VNITTTTDRSSYTRGASVRVSTRLVSSAACVLELVRSGRYDCGESVVIDTWSGEQAYPALGHGEQCGDPPREVLTPGTADSETVVWNQRTALAAGGTGETPPGRYQAIGSWSWRAGGGMPPYEVAADSAPFTITS